MTEFHYRSLDPAGSPRSGTIVASSIEQARRKLVAQGIQPLSVTSEVQGDVSATKTENLRLTRADVLFFTRELYHLKAANVPLDKSLQILDETVHSRHLRAFIKSVHDAVRSGKSLHAALQPHQDFLGRKYLALIKAGEQSGALTHILQDLCSQLEADHKLRGYLTSALIYPSILLAVAVGSVVLLLVFVVPQFRDIFDAMGDALPLSTQWVIALSDFMKQHWTSLLIALCALLLLGNRWYHSVSGRLAIDGLQLRLPLLGPVILALQGAVYFRTLALLLQRGVPLPISLNISAEAVVNAQLRQQVLPLAELVKTGKPLSLGCRSIALGQGGVHQLLRVAEQTGQLQPTLTALSLRLEESARATLGRLLSVIEPLIIICLGLLVAFIIIAILGGVLSINDTI